MQTVVNIMAVISFLGVAWVLYAVTKNILEEDRLMRAETWLDELEREGEHDRQSKATATNKKKSDKTIEPRGKQSPKAKAAGKSSPIRPRKGYKASTFKKAPTKATDKKARPSVKKARIPKR